MTLLWFSNFLTATCDFWTIHFWWSYFSLNRFLLCSLRTKLKCGLYYYVSFKWKFDFILYWNLSGTVDFWVPEIPILAKILIEIHPKSTGWIMKQVNNIPICYRNILEILLLAWYSMTHRSCQSFLASQFLNLMKLDWSF